MPRLFAIGDVHGADRPLQELIDKLFREGMDLDEDTLVFVGDLVDGDIGVRKVVEQVRSLQWVFGEDHVVVLRGNHEQLLIDGIDLPFYHPQFQLWYRQGGRNTAASYELPQTIMDQNTLVKTPRFVTDLEWMKQLPLSYETEKYIFVHAGLRPPFPLEAQSEHDLLWIREEFINSTYDWGKIVVFGHTVQQELLIMPNKIGIDTRGRGYGFLSAVELDDKGLVNHYTA